MRRGLIHSYGKLNYRLSRAPNSQQVHRRPFVRQLLPIDYTNLPRVFLYYLGEMGETSLLLPQNLVRLISNQRSRPIGPAQSLPLPYLDDLM